MSYPLIDPRTGKPTTAHTLSKETGIPVYRLWHRWDIQGIRSLSLISPTTAHIDLEAERRHSRELFLRSPAGRLTTIKRLGDYARAKRQQEQAA